MFAFLHHVINENDQETIHYFYAFHHEIAMFIEMCSCMLVNNRIQRLEKFHFQFGILYKFHPRLSIRYQI